MSSGGVSSMLPIPSSWQVLDLIANVYLGCGIVSDQYDGKSGSAMFCLECGNAGLQFAQDFLIDFLPIENHPAHALVRIARVLLINSARSGQRQTSLSLRQ